MEAAAIVCPKCNGQMNQGFVADKTRAAVEVMTWRPGPPETSFFSGTKLPAGSLPIAAFCCEHCGYLEFYASKLFGRH
ncbi:PF20097 family protein [Lacipirellula limnantheis]|uniref:DUF6487 domain-containing protein n=1 Tax=Lacipirellula limnantheis TaxID=2528024 RepID=A0A517U2B8_9BACT|nr:PF20097 family protein [Lacipirellula limnantheis]QDT74769.1 hypothetical protein I41_39700 [Lacipirellula limnantheis]